MLGLVDGNNFYASCERLFNPSLRQPALARSQGLGLEDRPAHELGGIVAGLHDSAGSTGQGEVEVAEPAATVGHPSCRIALA